MAGKHIHELRGKFTNIRSSALALQALELVSLGKDIIRSAETIQRSSKNQFDKPLQRIRRQIVAVANDVVRKLPVPNLANLVVTFTWAVEKIREVLLLDAVRLSLQETSILETLEEINLILDETIIDCQYGVNDYIVGFDSNNKVIALFGGNHHRLMAFFFYNRAC
ncbi:hypothetical protein DL93DRAFT_1964353 [Clavulina sp. PMI_390]|nr:hypothetical protein DL93DRAFT_1964353 [Clavulina sp. PMI_390]